MITREEAKAFLDAFDDENPALLAAAEELARTVVALYDELAAKDNLLRLAEASVALLKADLEATRHETETSLRLTREAQESGRGFMTASRLSSVRFRRSVRG